MKEKRQRVAIETPEHIELHFQIAGIGTRFLAYLLDKTIQAGAVLGLIFAFSLLFFLAGKLGSLGGWLVEGTKAFTRWLISLGTLAFGIMVFGYFLLFEMVYFTVFEYLWGGATPGKRYLNVRVIRQDARPITFIDAAVRNMMRFVDLLGQIYPIGLLVMFVDSRNRRLGDLAAGTLVVSDIPARAPSVVKPGKELPWLDSDTRTAVLEMTPEDYQLVAKFLARREGLDPEHRVALAREIYGRVFKRRTDPRAPGQDAEPALEIVASRYLDKMRIL